MCYISPMPTHHDIARALQAHKEASGESCRSVAARDGVPTRPHRHPQGARAVEDFFQWFFGGNFLYHASQIAEFLSTQTTLPTMCTSCAGTA